MSGSAPVFNWVLPCCGFARSPLYCAVKGGKCSTREATALAPISGAFIVDGAAPQYLVACWCYNFIVLQRYRFLLHGLEQLFCQWPHLSLRPIASSAPLVQSLIKLLWHGADGNPFHLLFILASSFGFLLVHGVMHGFDGMVYSANLD